MPIFLGPQGLNNRGSPCRLYVEVRFSQRAVMAPGHQAQSTGGWCFCRPHVMQMTSCAGGRGLADEASDQLGELLGLVLRGESVSVVDPLQARVRQELGELVRVLPRKEPVLTRPGDQHGAVELAESLGR